MTERAKHAAKIRDARRQDQRPRSGNSKSTKRWCRGVVGREHVAEWLDYVEAKNVSKIFARWRVLRCKNCGRELKYDYGRKK